MFSKLCLQRIKISPQHPDWVQSLFTLVLVHISTCENLSTCRAVSQPNASKEKRDKRKYVRFAFIITSLVGGKVFFAN